MTGVSSRSASGRTFIDPPVPASNFAVSAPAGDSWAFLLVAAISTGILLQGWGPAALQAVFRRTGIHTGADLGAAFGALLVSMVVHEAGHALAAWTCGFEFLGGRLGPLRMVRDGNGWGMRLEGQRWFAASISGVPQKKGCWRKHMLWVVGSGPLATLLLGIAAFWLIVREGAGNGSNFLPFLVEVNALLFLLGLIPNGRDAEIRNDASLLMALAEDTVEAQNILLYHVLWQIRLQGFRPCFYPEQIVRAMAAARPKPEVALLFACAISDWAFDRNDMATAEAWSMRALEMGTLCGIALQSTALAHGACMDLLIRQDYAAARRRCQEADIGIIWPSWLQQRTRGIAAVTNAQVGEALEAWQQAEYLLPHGAPFADYQRDSLRRLRLIASEVNVRPKLAGIEINPDIYT